MCLQRQHNQLRRSAYPKTKNENAPHLRVKAEQSVGHVSSDPDAFQNMRTIARWTTCQDREWNPFSGKLSLRRAIRGASHVPGFPLAVVLAAHQQFELIRDLHRFTNLQNNGIM